MKKAILIIVSQLSLVFTQAFAQIPELTHLNVIPPSPVASEPYQVHHLPCGFV